MTRIAVLDDYQGVALSLADWESLHDCEVTVFRDTLKDEAAVAARLQDFDVVCLIRERTPFPRSLVARLPRLRLVNTGGMRNKAIDLAACAERGIHVCGTDTGSSAAQVACGLILALARRIVHEDRVMRAGGWQAGLGRDLHGKTLGILGLGRLGSQVAAFGKLLQMDVVAWSRNLTIERCAAHGVGYARLDELLARSDLVSIHLVLSERTRGLLGARELALMKPGAFLVNTSRGPIVDEAALVAVLRERRIAGAGLDVYDEEPLPADHPLRGLDNTVLLPHMGYVTEETLREFYVGMVENVRAWLEGTPIRELRAD
jgi:phosphoglycerate dehydrogenase-like enzyme